MLYTTLLSLAVDRNAVGHDFRLRTTMYKDVFILALSKPKNADKVVAIHACSW